MKTRSKIILGLIVIIVTLYLGLAFVISAYLNKVFINEVQSRVHVNINAANNIYESNIDRVGQILQLISIHRFNSGNIKEEINNGLGSIFQNQYKNDSLDILVITDTTGKVVYRAHNPAYSGDNISDMPFIKRVMQNKEAIKGTMVLDEGFLKNENKDLLNKTKVEIKNTPNARKISKTEENRGMFIASAVPLKLSKNNKFIGIIFGGYLINNNTKIIDHVKTSMSEDPMYEGKEISAATIFLDDVRISTTFKDENKIRAVGSRLSEEVYNSVFKQRKQWEDRAFVVNDWYVTSYKPIRDIDGKIIGSLGIGLLEKPFTHFRKIIFLFFIICAVITAVISLVLMFFYTRFLMKPIESIIKMSKRIMQGDFSARTHIRPSGELGLLCAAMDRMAQSIEQHERKVQEETQKQIIQAEKLASIGRLAAGIAHEINNPLTGVLNYAHFLKEKKTNNESDLNDIGVIIKETTRVRDIIRGLLDFARQSPSNKMPVDVNETIHTLLKLVKGQKEFRNIQIIEKYDDKLPELKADRNQLQQVLLNLVLNSGEAITGDGSITISTGFKDNNVVITINDTGCGISKADIDKIFDPFFTTKPVGKGTGLGLSVSYGIIEQHGGTIECESNPGEGATFRVILPVINDDNN